ncbi:MAG TPA: PKD domain-containing protein, partial [Chitinophagaceae bacterium]|nr:PKD domain-containing protein [Chitinophagaceae bacterium]
MKKLVATIIALSFFIPLFASHIRGGEVYYAYQGPGAAAGTSKYLVTLKLYIRCDANDNQKDANEPFTIYRNSNNTQYGSFITAPLSSQSQISYDPASNPCITNPPTDICYLARYYDATIELPDDPAGYTISFQRCCRIAGIENLVSPSDDYGVTYLCKIPGTNVLPLPDHNSSPVITGNDAVAICVNSYFTFDFSAKDPDNDSLVYQLCDAYNGASKSSPNPQVASAPPYSPLPYLTPFSGGNPLGLQVTINSATGIISGIAPGISAQYVVTGCISEYRHGVLINVHRKDIHLRIADCTPLKAVLKPNYDYCDDFLTSFKNEQSNPTGTIYIWQFGDGTKADTTSDPVGAMQHQYADTGTFTVKLKVILAGQCTDSTSTLAKVYPGFYPGFVANGSCILNAVQFIDTSKTKYGTVNKWHWDFGDLTSNADSSLIKNPSWKYSDTGTKKVVLIVQSDKGCIDTVSQDVSILLKPKINLPFKDTLICSNATTQDTLQLHATGFGVFSWTPLTRILLNNTPDPLVYPTVTTTYYVHLDENGCVNDDSVRVRVVGFVTLDAGPDTTICLTDPVTLSPSGNGLKYTWTPVATLNNPNVKNPVATPTATTSYQAIAYIGKCSAADNVTIRTIPYPGSKAGPDQIICYMDTVQLNGTIVGSSFSWSPAYRISSTSVLNPQAWPLKTVGYVLQVYDTLGCPKPGLDTVVVTVRPPVIAFAGNDTSVVVNQPLVLTATGAQFYLWSPATHLDRNNVQSPTALFDQSGVY